VQALPCSRERTPAECWRWRVAACPFHALWLPNCSTGECRFPGVPSCMPHLSMQSVLLPGLSSLVSVKLADIASKVCQGPGSSG
jgi:hypothetical protein